ncbi:Histone-lysine N-methyltransferase SETMAR [Eumeta japonica]|uniref:Histone-lysine N-methyltransferase SETMAR n=1 Tax=Eumeta variegata TaxID=151549 RepID=A0A4C1YI11_EUMVA|nr:Histone-lysine N-methyltransferase SETMAR [Eumeta japonica]
MSFYLRETIYSDLYCQQLMRLKQEVEKKRPELIKSKSVVFHRDNARPHAFLATHKILRGFGWEVLMHPPYRPDLVPSDFHLFLPLQNSLRGSHWPSCTIASALVFTSRDRLRAESEAIAITIAVSISVMLYRTLNTLEISPAVPKLTPDRQTDRPNQRILTTGCFGA